MYLSKNIKVLRKSQKLSQSEISEALGVNSSSISMYEGDKSVPSFDVLLKMSEIFGVSLDDLVFRDIENEGLSGSPKAVPEAKDATEDRLITLLEQRVKMLEREIARVMPDVAEELGIEVKRKKDEKNE